MKLGKAILRRCGTALLLASLLMAVLPGTADATAQPEASANPVPEAQKGVVQICSYDTDRGKVGTGTGFGIGKAGEDTDIFITNWHVVTQSGKGYTDVYLVLDNSDLWKPDTMIPCEVLYLPKQYPDFAILRAKKPVSGIKALPLMRAEKASVGAPIYVLGYPGFVDDFTERTNSRIGDMTVTQGIISRFTLLGSAVRVSGEASAKIILHTAHSGGGNSGGPMITEDGAVIGLHTYSYTKEDTLNRAQAAVYIDYAMDALDELGIAYDVYTGEEAPAPGEQPSQPSPQPTQPGPQPSQPSPQPAQPGPQPSQPSSQPAASKPASGAGTPQILAIIGIVAVAAIAVILLLASSSGKGPRITGTGSFHAGKHFKIPAQGLNIGRDAGCGIVFPDKTPGVSRMHCRINRSGEKLTITDLNSTYGTYVAGKKIAPNVPVRLPKGVGFYVGTPKNSFVVE